MTSDWAFVLAGIVVSILLVPLFLYVAFSFDPLALSDGSFLPIGLLAMLPGFLMGGIGLWTAARG